MDILVCSCIILILLIIHVVWPLCVFNPRYDKLQSADILGKNEMSMLKTGDIIMFRNCTACKCGDSILDSGFQMTYKNLFNSARWYLQGTHYTHVAVIICLPSASPILPLSPIPLVPYICHMDGGDPMLDALEHGYIAGTSVVVSDLEHINVRGGYAHLYKYKGLPINKNMAPFIQKHRSSEYPQSFYNLVTKNVLKMGRHPRGIFACTDFVEDALHELGILNRNDVSRQSTIKDIEKIIHTCNYDTRPIILENKCWSKRH